MEKWSEDRLVSTFEEKTNMNWEEWKYRKAIKQCGGFRGELMRVYIDDVEQFGNW